MRVIYFPLEPYKERYTTQLSSGDGWVQTAFRSEGLEVIRIEGSSQTDVITSGVVLDSCGRGVWATTQISNFLTMLQQERYSPQKNDVFYFDDFWHPGIEAIPYAYQMKGLPFPRMFAYLWAQSVDEFDFTVEMLPWIRHYEKANASILEGIFVASTLLKEFLVCNGVGDNKKIHVVGLPFNSEQVLSMNPCPFEGGWFNKEPKNKVIFSSRWDKEKRPDRFLKIVEETMTLWGNPREDIEFVITTSSDKLRSNEPELLRLLKQAQIKYPNLTVKTGLSKQEYYRELSEAKVQVNTADQDWVSFTLLEALTFGCLPVYPFNRSFPEVLSSIGGVFLYENLFQAANLICLFLYDYGQQAKLSSADLAKLVTNYDNSLYRIAKTMKGEWYELCY